MSQGEETGATSSIIRCWTSEILTCAAARAFFPSASGLFCTAIDILLMKSFKPLACTTREEDLLVVNRAGDDLAF